MTTSIKTIRIVIDTQNSQTNVTNLNRNIVGTENAANRSAFAMNKLAKAIGGVIAAVGAVNAVKGIAAIGDEYAKITGLLKLATNTQDEFNFALAESKRIAEETRAPLSSTVETYAALNRVTKDLKISQKDLFGVLETINKSISLTSPNAESAAAALTQFGQALGGDFKAGSQELNSILEQTPGLADAVAKGLGVPTKALKKMGEEGQLSTELVITGLQAIASEVDKQFAQVPKTISSQTTLIKNDLLETFGDAEVAKPLIDSLGELRETLKDPGVKDGLIGIGKALITIVEWGAKAVSIFGEMGKNLGYFAARATNSVDEIEVLERKLKDLNDDIASNNIFKKGLGNGLLSKEELKEKREVVEAQIALIYKRRGVVIQTEEELAKIAADKKITEDAEIKRNEDAAKLKVEELKKLNEQKELEKDIAKEKERKRKEIEREIGNLKELVATTGQSKQVEIRYKLEILGASKQEINDAVEMAKKLDDLEAQKKIKKATEETSSEIASAQSVTKQLEAELITRQKVSDFYREARLAKAKGEFEEQRALLKAQEQEKIAVIEQRELEEIQRREDQLRKALDYENLTETQKQQIRAAYREQELAAEAVYEEEKNAIREQGIRTRQQIDELEFKARLTSFGALGNALMQLGEGQSKKVFETGKALALAQAAVALPSAVLESFKNGGGYPWGLIPAGAMLATGLKNIQSIKSAKFGGSTASASVGSGGGGGSSAPLPTTNGGNGTGETFQQKQVIEVRGVDANSFISGSQLVDILQRDDNVVVALQGAQQDAQRRGVI